MEFPRDIFQKPAHMILILAILQVLSATYLLKIGGVQAVNSILFLFCGLGISYFILKIPSFKTERRLLINKQLWGKAIFILVLLPVSYFAARKMMDSTPLQIEYADMLPIMKTMSGRFIEGNWRHVYDPIPEIWGGVQPIYLPAMWMPFTASLIFDFDMRWITVCGIWLSVALCIWPGIWKRNVSYVFFALTILTLLTWLHIDGSHNVIRLTEEGVVFFYFSLLAVAIISGNPWLIGVTAALCLLSRYALIGWIPFAGLYLLLTGQFRYLLKILAAGAIVVLLILLIPFGWKPLLNQLPVATGYVSLAARVWDENPEFFYTSLGMAKFFGPRNIALLHSIVFWGTFIFPLLFLGLIKKKSIPSNIVLLSSFQFCVTFFYNFVDVSYLYLYYTPVFVSLVIAGWALMTAERRENNSVNSVLP